MSNKWTEQEIDILKDRYAVASKEELVSKIPRTWDAIIQAAEKHGLSRKRLTSEDQRRGDVTRLLEDIPPAYYWAGFISADGSIFNNKRLKLCLGISDYDHLSKFSTFLGIEKPPAIYTNGVYGNCSMSIQDSWVIPKFCAKFDLKPKKTYHPPTGLVIPDPDLLLSYIIGFIDGDGYLGKQSGRDDCVLVIKNHASWLGILQTFERHLYDQYQIGPHSKGAGSHSKLNNAGYATLTISDCRILWGLNKFAKDHDLPVLDRKWRLVTTDPETTRYSIAEKKREGCKRMLLENISRKDISKKLGISESRICQIAKELKL